MQQHQKTKTDPAPVLALDIGNVCVHVEFLRFLGGIGLQSPEDLATYDQDGSLTGLCHDFERGRIGVDEFLHRFGIGAPKKFDREQALLAWHNLIGDEIEGIAELVADAKELGIAVVFISDICPLHYDYVLQRITFGHHVDGAILSYEVGELKPHAAMYEAMELQYCNGRPPLLYADDREQNIAAALERGWQAYQFGDVKTLRMRFEELVRKQS